MNVYIKARKYIARFKNTANALRQLQRFWQYRKNPRFWMIASIVFAYLFSPLDVIPDFTPIIGFLDDAVVIATAIHSLETQTHSLSEFKKRMHKALSKLRKLRHTKMA